MNRQIEVLAPAGSLAICKAVINAGADAVYLGGDAFGARAYAGNLNMEELKEAIDYAHFFNRKIYLTVNTLLKNQELENQLFDFLSPLYQWGLDAVIVQDYGVMDFVHKNFPQLDIHASTQMTITDEGYLDFLSQYNVTRIVTARELSLKDIHRLHEYMESHPTGIKEIESFVHGALCYCYSGQCLMSSFIGGRSGNRGRCAQPCRLDYTKDGQTSALLSLKDLCTIDILPQIIEAGVMSLKIEGRMKSAAYAAGVTSVYRKYVDMYLSDKDSYRVDKKDYDRLLMLFDRGGIDNGYYLRHNGRDMIANPQKAVKSLKEKELLEKDLVNAFCDNDLKKNIHVFASVYAESGMDLCIFDDEDHNVLVHADIVSAAQKHPLTEAELRKQINRFGNTFLHAEDIDIQLDDNIFIPNGALNELRREAVRQYCDLILEPFKRQSVSQAACDDENTSACPEDIKISVRVMTKAQARAAIEKKAARIYIECDLLNKDDIRNIAQMCKDSGIECFICFPRIFKNEYKGLFSDAFNSFKDIEFDGFLLRNIAQLKDTALFTDKKIVSDYSIYCFNHRTAGILGKSGFSLMNLPVELNCKELRHLGNGPFELMVYGRIPLMSSAGCIDANTSGCHKGKPCMNFITDRKGKKLPYITSCDYCHNVIFNSDILYLLDKYEDICKISPGYVSYSFVDESYEECIKVLGIELGGKQALNYFNDNTGRFTRGHFMRGVE